MYFKFLTYKTQYGNGNNIVTLLDKDIGGCGGLFLFADVDGIKDNTEIMKLIFGHQKIWRKQIHCCWLIGMLEVKKNSITCC